MNQDKLNQFMAVYTPALKDAVEQYPAEYMWPVSDVPMVADRMRAAIDRGSYNHSGRAFKATCKALGIKPTRKAITEFLK